MVKLRRTERGQSVLFFAVLLPILAIFLLVILDYMVTNARVMESVAVADLAAHAGAQEISVLPDGLITIGSQGETLAASYFTSQAPSYTRLSNVVCGRHQNRPACLVRAQVQSAGYLWSDYAITVNAIGYFAHGVTRDDQ